MVVNFDGEFQSSGVHHSAAAGGGGIDLDRAFTDDEFLVEIIFSDTLLEITAHISESGFHFGIFPVACGGVHHFGKVESDHGHTGFQSHVDIGNGLQVVAVSPPAQLIVAFENAENRIIHDGAESTVGHRKFTHRLLSNHRRNLELHSGSNVSGSGKTETVAAAHGGFHIAQTFGSAPGEMLTQSGGIGAVQFTHESHAAVGESHGFTGETGGNGFGGVSHHQQETFFAVTAHHHSGFAQLVNGSGIDFDIAGFQAHGTFDAFKILADNSKNGLCNFLHFLVPYYVSVEIQTHFYNTIDII